MSIPYRPRLICLLLVIGLYSCRIDDREPSLQEIPIYPNAQIVPIKDRTTESSLSIRLLISNPIEDVEAFYQTELPKLGWQFEGESGGHFGYFNLNHNGSSNYELVLRMSIGSTENQKTVVLIDQFIAYKGQNIGLTP
jgi:hypothetical protein